MNIKRGDIFYADLRPVVGSEQGGVRPVLIVQNDTGNRHSPTVIIAAITSRMKHKLPTHVEIDSKRYDMIKDSVILLEQLRTIDKARLKDKVCHLDNEIITKVNEALITSLEIQKKDKRYSGDNRLIPPKSSYKIHKKEICYGLWPFWYWNSFICFFSDN